MDSSHQPFIRYRRKSLSGVDRVLAPPQSASSPHRAILHLNSSLVAREFCNPPVTARERHSR
jgi:hypothetical protein